MQQADFVGLLRTILIILLVYYGLKIIGRFLFPLLMKRFVGKVEKQFQEQQGYYRKEEPATKVGETVIDKKPGQQNKSNDDVGEYTDYEEVD